MIIATLHADIDRFLGIVRQRKAAEIAKKTFKKWDYENRYTSCNHLKNGRIKVGPDAIFRHQKDALKCFGYNKGHHQSGSWNLPSHVCNEIGLSGKCIPKLYEHSDWNNTLSDDGQLIVERNNNPEYSYTEKWDKRIVMAHARDELNRTLYRFLGVFEVIPGHHTGNELRFQRISTTVKMYSANT